MSRKVFRDAVHDMIILHRMDWGPDCAPVDWGDGLLLDLIDTPQLQRLRRIRQLGPAAKVYPSAEHSRFSHSLGTLHLVKRMIAQAIAGGGAVLTPAHILAIKVSALFHDVGHGPHSHVFEQILPGLPDHEAWGWRILSEAAPVQELFERHGNRLGLDREAFRDDLREIWHPGPPRDHLGGRPFIASQLDADRMDYLLRDAHFTGVSYGRFDLEWLLHSLKVRTLDGRGCLCVDLGKGPAALESYIFARDHMYRQVYDHKTVRAFETLLIHIFGLIDWIWAIEGQPPPETPPALTAFLESARQGRVPDLEVFLALDDTVIDYALGRWSMLLPQSAVQEELRRRCRMYCHRKPIYRRLKWKMPAVLEERGQLSFGFLPPADVSGVMTLEPMRREPELATDLIHDAALVERIERFFRDHEEEMIPTPQEDGSILAIPLRLLVRVDRIHRSPYIHPLDHSQGTDPIHVITQEGKVCPAERESPLVHFLGLSRRRQARVFVDPRVVDRVHALARTCLAPWME
ncbi:MAG: HD domain-containing protein [Magnetococcales bacterium]|nr:HD domain-containing protein [Magnetococcales bacterium]